MGHEDERLHGLDERPDEPVDDGEAEGGRLARAGPRLDDEAPPLGRRLEHGALDRRRVAVPHLVDRARTSALSGRTSNVGSVVGVSAGEAVGSFIEG